MVGSRVFVVKERDEWSNFAEFVGAMVAKYADKMDFESLPETNCQGLFNQIHKKSTKKVPEAPYGS